MTMNFMVYAIGMLAYWAVGFALQAGGSAALATLAAMTSSTPSSPSHRWHAWGLFGMRLLPDGSRLQRLHLCVFPLSDGVHGHHRDDSHRCGCGALEVLFLLHLTVFIATIIYPIYGNGLGNGCSRHSDGTSDSGTAM